MDIPVFEQLQKDGLVSPDTAGKIKAVEAKRPISVHWDLRTLLYFGILLLTTGLGILLYKNIDTIGHATLITLTGMLSAACFVYCFRSSGPFSHSQVAAPNVLFDYILLLGCLLMLAFVGYLQYQYQIFGHKWGLATFLPMLFLFFCAYYFDHKGILSMAIANLGAWMGVAVDPMKLARNLDSADMGLIVNGVMLGAILHLFTWLTAQRNFKAHFAPVYKNFGVHVLFISLFCGMGQFDDLFLIWLLLALVMVAVHTRIAYLQRSFYFLVMAIIYGYVAVSFAVCRLLSLAGWESDFAVCLVFLYFIASAAWLVQFLIRLNKTLKQ
jgi:Predicted membrane protein (DUF2157)